MGAENAIMMPSAGVHREDPTCNARPSDFGIRQRARLHQFGQSRQRFLNLLRGLQHQMADLSDWTTSLGVQEGPQQI
jgi:hypothetical protein